MEKKRKRMTFARGSKMTRLDTCQQEAGFKLDEYRMTVASNEILYFMFFQQMFQDGK